MTPSAPRNLLLAATLVAGAACWLVPVHLAEPGAAPGAGAWLGAAFVAVLSATVLLPYAQIASKTLAGDDEPSRVLEAAMTAVAAALATGGSVALFVSTAGRSLPVELARDVALSLFVTAPLALLATARQRAAAPAGETLELAPARGTTRRNFIKVGAGGVATAAAVRLAPVAAAQTKTFHLTITDGDLHMIDEVPVFFRGFAGVDGKLQVPGPFLGNPGPFESGPEILEGQTVHVTVTNLTPRDHTFLIERTESETPSDPVVLKTIPAGGIPVDIEFTAPDAGTYIYRDADRNNRILGMHGVMIVMPRSGENRPFTQVKNPDGSNKYVDLPAEFLAQYVWVLHDIDPLLGELARSQPNVQHLDYPLEKVVPRYFTINGVSGVESTESLVTVPVFPVQDSAANQVGTLIRVVNTGVASHSPHWHGNHIFVVQRNEAPCPAGFVLEKDVVRMPALNRISVFLPVHSGLDAWPPLDPVKGFEEQEYPMHCHAEMSQTAAGGLYPMGMLTDWRLVAKPQDVAAARARVVSGTKTRRAKAQIARVLRQR